MMAKVILAGVLASLVACAAQPDMSRREALAITHVVQLGEKK